MKILFRNSFDDKKMFFWNERTQSSFSFTFYYYYYTSKQCDQKKSPNVYKSCPKMILQEKW